MFNLIEKSRLLGTPVDLLKITIGSEIFAMTSSSRAVIHPDGLVYEPVAWECSAIKKAKADKQELVIKLPVDHPLSEKFKVSIPSRETVVSIYRKHDTISPVFFTGRVLGVRWNGTNSELICESVISTLNRQGLRNRFSIDCNHNLYSESCGVNIDDYSTEVEIKDISKRGRLLKIDLVQADENYYTDGLATFNEQHRSIDYFNVQTKILELKYPFEDLRIGDKIRIAKGCSKNRASCQSFNNITNFFGFTSLPDRNPFETGIE